MKRFLTFLLLVFVVACALPGSEGEVENYLNLARIGKAVEMDLSTGTLLRFEDNHGGFLGDGQTTAEIALDGLSEALADAPGWPPLPMSANAAQTLRVCGLEGAAVEQGYYYLCDRHGESCDPYSDAELCTRASWNFTMAIYDSRNGRLYFYQLDT